MTDRPIGFELHGGGQPPQGPGYPPINATPGYGAGYGAAYPPEGAAMPGYHPENINYYQAEGGNQYQQAAPVPYQAGDNRSFTPPVETRYPAASTPPRRVTPYGQKDEPAKVAGARTPSGQTRQTSVSEDSNNLLKDEQDDFRTSEEGGGDSLYFKNTDDGLKKVG
eukprot:gene12692-13994_t